MFLIYFLLLLSLVKQNICSDLSEQQYNEVKNSRNFTGKVVLVTGSSSGIGEGIVKLFSSLGAQVVVTGRNKTKIDKVAQEVQRLSPQRLQPLKVTADLRDSKQLKRLLDKTIERYKKLDVLVNNAGVYPLSPINSPNFMQTFDEIFSLDVRAYVEVIYRAIPYLNETNGTIISISSILGIIPASPSMAYCSAKAAVNMMTKVLALELGPRIRVNAINPGPVEVEAIHFLDRVKTSIPLKRLATPYDIAKGAVFLASSDAKQITGTNLLIDGGSVLNHPGYLSQFLDV